jgi:hypothetical protein
MTNKWTKNNIINCINNSDTYKDIIINMNLVPCTSSYLRLNYYLKYFNIEFIPTKYKIKNKWKMENLKQIIEESHTQSEVLVKMGLSTIGSNHKTLLNYIELYNLNISHFNKNINKQKNNSYLTTDILIKNSPYKSTSTLKERLYKEGLKERMCEKCGQGEEWYGEHMSLILDHINGINNDNRIENLRIVCPNCNATLPTHCRGNLLKIKKEKTQKILKLNYCNCGKIIDINANKCKKCYQLSRRKTNRPPYDQLLKEVKETNYCAVGRKYGVSDTTIRKWLKYMGQ